MYGQGTTLTTATTRTPTPTVRGPAELRVVVAHDFAETYGGAERLLAEILDAFPSAPLWTILGRRSVARRMGVEDRFHTLLPERDRLLRRYRGLAPLFPALVRARRLPAADVLVTSSYAFAHGFRTVNDAPQVCYCHGPLRFAWSQTDGYAAQAPGGAAGGAFVRLLGAGMRRADARVARSVTRYLTQSEFTAEQIRRFYRREADVVGPPVDCARFVPTREAHEDFFLFCGRLVEAYKRPSLVVEAFRRMPGRRLVIAGDGPERRRLEQDAPANVTFAGHLEDRELVALMGRCAAAIFPSRDDFGLIPVEVAACGRPSLVYAGGGALHTVRPGVTGEFFHEQTAGAIVDAVERFSPDAYDPAVIRTHAERWDRRHFRRALVGAVRDVAGVAGVAGVAP